jgi:hypothetical protein
MVSPPSVQPVLLPVTRPAGPWPAGLAVSPPSVLPVLLSVARAAGSQPAGLVSVWAPALAVSAARPAELPPLLVAVRGLTVLLPLGSGLRPRRARFSPMGRRPAEQPVVPSR